MRARLALPALLLVLLVGCDAGPKVAFADVSITLPDDPNVLPEGPGREVVLENCTACHSATMLLQQPRIDRAKWEGLVTKMREVYKAPVDAQAVPQIVDYMLAVQARQDDEAK
ncbi:MAG: cytochrome c [Erythrobacter sp.]